MISLMITRGENRGWALRVDTSASKMQIVAI